MTAMHKTELIEAVAKKAGISKADADKAVNSTLEVIKEQLAKGENVTITGFGTFEVRQAAARKGINPQTKEKIDIPAKKRAAFTAGSELRKAVSS
jgi:DNA-binding protein HU-beta